MYPDIFYIISLFCDFDTLINLKQTCKNAYRGIKITYIPVNKKQRLNDEILKGLSNLVSLNCIGCRTITDEGIRNLKQLRTLNCSWCPNITDEGIKYLTQLRTLYCEKCDKITDKGFRHLTQLEKLNCSWCPKITDKGMKYLTQLQVLNCDFCRNITIGSIKNMRQLQILNCSICGTITKQTLDCKCFEDITDEKIIYMSNMEFNLNKLIDDFIMNRILYCYLERCSKTNGTDNKKQIAIMIFEILIANKWFLEKHERFSLAVSNKLKELYSDESLEGSSEYYYLLFGNYLQ